ncbi:MAG: hypothetical protein KME43_19260 [Myxacorys chilensis ATA2-1-KO14]|nr:hypothetical protein [Myxacorys chilensis ATA2-1-KO14]
MQPAQQHLLIAFREEFSITLSSGQTYPLPGAGGAVMESGGIITYPGGAKLQFVIEDGKIIGGQLFRADGSKLQPGEVLIFPDGTTMEQEEF